jgi:GTPase Era involved in 16S rRNA processing
MKEFAVVGRPNSGKTLFVLNFAAYLHCKTVDMTFRSPDGLLGCRHFALPEAKRELCGPALHKTRTIQSVVLKVPVGKTAVAFKFTDTCGIQESIHENESIRRGMAQTLGLIRSGDFIIHLVDLTAVTDPYLAEPGNIDQEVYHYGIARQRYLLLANKVDLPPALPNLPRLSAAFGEATVIAISALTGQGFAAVKAQVAQNV